MKLVKRQLGEVWGEFLNKVNSPRTQTKVPNRIIRKGPLRRRFLYWISINIFRELALLLIMGIFLTWIGPQEATNENVILLLFGLYFGMWTIVKELEPLGRKYRIWRDLGIIEEESMVLTFGADPTQRLIGAMNDLRLKLIEYVEKPYGIVPMVDYYQSQLDRRIDILFSCVSEILYSTSYRIGKGTFPADKNELNTFSYQMLTKWAREIAEHLMGKRKMLKYSGHELPTLKYLLGEKLADIKRLHRNEYKEYFCSVNEFYNGLENQARSKRELFRQFIQLAAVAVVSVIGATVIPILFGMNR